MAFQLQRSSHQIFMIQMDAESSPSPQTASLPCRQVALLTASIRSVLAARACREGLEGPSLTRLREAPQVEIFQNSQDGSLVTTPRRPVLHWWLSMCSHLWLQESSLLKAAQQLQMPIGNTRRTICGAGIRQGCVTAPGITKLLLGPPSRNTPKDFLLQMGSAQGATAKTGIKPTSPVPGHRVSCLPLPNVSRCPWARRQLGSMDKTGCQHDACAPCPGYAVFQR